MKISVFFLLCIVSGIFCAQVNLIDLNVPWHSATGIDYHFPTDSLIVSVRYPDGQPFNFERIEQDGTFVQFSTISGLTDEVKIATVKEDDPFEDVGTFYVGTGAAGTIARVTADGLSIDFNWVHLVGETGLMRGSLYVDRTGVFGYDLIAVTTAGGVWRIDRVTKSAVKLASKGVHLEGVITVADDPVKYGFLAGKILIGAEGQRDLHWVDAAGNTGKWHLASIAGNADVAIEDIDLIEGNFFAIAYGNGKILGAPSAEFAALRGHLLLTMEYAGLFVLTWDFVNSVPRAVPLDFSAPFPIAQFEHVTFAPFGITTIPEPEEECNATGTYRTQSEGDWGDQCSEGFETGCYRDDKFDECFPDGLKVGCDCGALPTRNGGCGYSIHLSSSSAVENFLPQLGNPDVLDHDYFDPSNPPPMSTSSGNFGGQVTALALSLGFEECDKGYHTACGKLADLYVCDNRCAQCKRNGNCKKNNNGCRFLREEELEVEEEDEIDFRSNKNQNFNNNNNGKPKYANCEAYFGLQVWEIFEAASKVLGGCADCGGSVELSKKTPEERNNKNNNNCVRTNKCRRSAAARNNNNCNRNSDCKRNQNCCCCPEQVDPLCDPVLLNNCVTLINQAFIFGKTLDDVQSGTLFKEKGCSCDLGYEWVATVNEQTVPLQPFVVPIDVTSYYGFNVGDAASANTPDGLEDTNAGKALVEFVTDGFGLHNLLVIYDKPQSGAGGTALSRITHDGTLDGATFIVQDDNGENFNVIPGLATTNNAWATCCTDGYVFGPIPNLACFTFELGPTTGVNFLRLASKGSPDGTAIEVVKNDADTIVVEICNRCKQA